MGLDADDIKQFKTWYAAMTVAGVALAVASLAAGDKGGFLIGLGMILAGIGEFANHPFVSSIQPGPAGISYLYISGHPRRPKPFGIAMNLCGLAIFVVGLILFIAD